MKPVSFFLPENQAQYSAVQSEASLVPSEASLKRNTKELRLNFANKKMHTENQVVNLLQSPDKDFTTLGELQLELNKIKPYQPRQNFLTRDDLRVIGENVSDMHRTYSYETKCTEETLFNTLKKVIDALPSIEDVDKLEIESEIMDLEKCTNLILDTVFHTSDIIMNKLTHYDDINSLSSTKKDKVSMPPEMVNSLKKIHEHDIYNAINILENFESLEESNLRISEKNKEKITVFKTKLKELKINKSLLKDIRTGEIETPFDWVKQNVKTISKYSACSILGYKCVDIIGNSYIKVLDKAMECFENQDEKESCFALFSAALVLFSVIMVIPLILYKCLPSHNQENNDL